MSTRRPIYLKVVDAVALLLVGGAAASLTSLVFGAGSWPYAVVSVVLALAYDYWFVSLILQVRYLWTGREARLLRPLRRQPRSAG